MADELSQAKPEYKPLLERHAGIALALADILAAAEGLNGIGRTLSALLIGGDYEEEGHRLIDDHLMIGELYRGIEALSGLILGKSEIMESMLEELEMRV